MLKWDRVRVYTIRGYQEGLYEGSRGVGERVFPRGLEWWVREKRKDVGRELSGWVVEWGVGG